MFIRLFINWLRSYRLNLSIKGTPGAIGTVPEIVPPDATIDIELEPTLFWVPTLAVGSNMMMICDEGGSESNEESEGPGEESSMGTQRGMNLNLTGRGNTPKQKLGVKA